MLESEDASPQLALETMRSRGGVYEPELLIVISVSDTDCGRPGEVAGRVFDPFTTEVGTTGQAWPWRARWWSSATAAR